MTSSAWQRVVRVAMEQTSKFVISLKETQMGILVFVVKFGPTGIKKTDTQEGQDAHVPQKVLPIVNHCSPDAIV